MTDFLGDPTHQPKSRDVARYVGLVRELVGKKPKDQTLATVTAFFFALAEFAVHAFGHLETLRIIKAIRLKTEDTNPDGKLSPWA